MHITDTAIADVKILTPRCFADTRGFFMESFNQHAFDQAIGRAVTFVQDNHSHSRYGVLRGLHAQQQPYAQAKLVRCLSGEIFDVAVDIRPDSATFGRWVGVYLSAENQQQLWIPEGFAHGFLVLSPSADVLYKTNQYYQPDAELCLAWDDPDVLIHWPTIEQIQLSDKDQQGKNLYYLY